MSECLTCAASDRLCPAQALSAYNLMRQARSKRLAGRHAARTRALCPRLSPSKKAGQLDAQLQSQTVQRKSTAIMLSTLKGGISTVRAQIRSNFSSMPLEPSPETRHDS
eukprot:2611403-Pleurochrysis_carterae.AAC.1